MRYYCVICLRDIKKKSKYSHLKSKSHQEFEKYKHIMSLLNNFEIKDVDEVLFLYIKDHNKKIIRYLLKGQFSLVLNNNQGCNFLFTCMNNNTTNISWSNYFREAIDSLKKKDMYSIILLRWIL